MGERRVCPAAVLAILVLWSCAAVDVVKTGLDLLGVATGHFVPDKYQELCQGFIDVLKKMPTPEPADASTVAAADPTPTHPELVAQTASIASTPPIAIPAPASDAVTAVPRGEAADAPPLQVEFDIVKEAMVENREVALPVHDGDVLRDGSGNPEAGDNYKILFRASAPCHVYIVQVDATAKIDTLFPGGFGNGQNPVQPNVELALPTTDWFYLDQNKGVETIYFFATREPHQELERLLNEIERNKPTTPPPVRIEKPIVASRGVAGTRPGRNRQVQLNSGQTVSVAPTSFIVSGRSAEVVLTKWFHHE
ncbi:MAG: DUF4384 domain-containing protein [Planctomycetota bacterium]